MSKKNTYLSQSSRQPLPSLTGKATGRRAPLGRSTFGRFDTSKNGVWGWVFIFLISCTSRPTSIPTTFTELTDSAVIYPDYRDVTVPPNIAPMNFMVRDASATEFVVEMGDVVTGATEDGKFDIDSTAWRKLLTGAKGKDITVNIYGHRENGWVRYVPYRLHVAEEDIDGYLSYRLIEPGYELYRQIGLYQRNLSNFDEAVIYENNRKFDNDNNHCVNCHNYQAYDTERMLFHVRAAHGGTIIVNGSEAHKIAIKHDSILGAGVYPTWHPTLPLVAFSSNKTGQVFHIYHPEKIEVLDEASDLILYDAEANTVRNILRTTNDLETFPCWAPDGRRLYYCSARMPSALIDNYSTEMMAQSYDSLMYNVYSMSFDPDTRTFGAPQLEVDAVSMGKSASVPRVSPDGKYLLFTLGDYGQFHIWHKSADLWVKRPTPNPSRKGGELASAQLSSDSEALPLAGERGEGLYPLTEANAPNVPDSYHSWSSNGRWIVFASRRDDGNFSRAFIAYFDRDGQAHRAFMLPQRDPEYNTLLLKSYNVPELTKSAVQVSFETLKHVVYHTEAEAAAYQ